MLGVLIVDEKHPSLAASNTTSKGFQSKRHFVTSNSYEMGISLLQFLGLDDSSQRRLRKSHSGYEKIFGLRFLDVALEQGKCNVYEANLYISWSS